MNASKRHELEKIIAWGLIVVIFSVFFFLVLQQAYTQAFFQEGNLAGFLNKVILPIIVFSAFLGAFGVLAMITVSKTYRYVVTGLVSIVPFLFFKPSTWSMLAVVGFFVVLTIFHETIRGDQLSRIKVRPLYTLAAGLSTIIIALLIPICLLYYSTYEERPHALDQIRASLRDNIVSVGLDAIGTQVDGFSADATLDQVIANILAGRIQIDALPFLEDSGPEGGEIEDERIEQLKAAIEAQTGEAVTEEELQNAQDEMTQEQKDQFAAVITEQLGEAEQQLIAEVRNELIASMGIEAEGDDTMTEVFGQFVDRRIISFVDPYLKYVPIIFTVSLFFVLYIFSFLFKYLTRGFGLTWFWVLKVTHFVFILEKDVKAEYIALEKKL